MRAALLLFLFIALSACNSIANTPEAQTVTPAITTPVVSVSDGADKPAPTETVAQPNSTTGSETIDCGELAIFRGGSSKEQVHTASACFLKAFSVCQSALLTVHQSSGGIVRQFSIEPGTKCFIREAIQPDPNSPPAVVDCTDANERQGDLVISWCSHMPDLTLSPFSQ